MLPDEVEIKGGLINTLNVHLTAARWRLYIKATRLCTVGGEFHTVGTFKSQIQVPQARGSHDLTAVEKVNSTFNY